MQQVEQLSKNKHKQQAGNQKAKVKLRRVN